jgi:hypothetical protein
MARRPYVPKIRFGPCEDSLLATAVDQLGTANWAAVAQMVPGRTPRQCRERWNNYVNPDLSNEPWTDRDDQFLLSKFQELGSKWQMIADLLPGKSRNAVRNRIYNLNRNKALHPKDASVDPVADQKTEDGHDPDQLTWADWFNLDDPLWETNPLF